MCRHLAYLGPPRSLASLVLEPPHSLLRQTWAPADMRGGGSVNADGFGIGWYVDGTVVRYRRSCPMWADASLPGLAATTTAEAVLASVRNATTGMPVTELACAPFTEGGWLFSHNGRVAGWPDSVAGLAGELPTTDLMTLEAPTDSVLLWALVRHRRRSGHDPTKAVLDVVRSVRGAAPGSRLNLLLTDGVTIVATAETHALWTWHDDDRVLVASEPSDPADHRWTAVPDGHLVVATRSTIDVQPT